jgi:hypothetical protein
MCLLPVASWTCEGLPGSNARGIRTCGATRHAARLCYVSACIARSCERGMDRPSQTRTPVAKLQTSYAKHAPDANRVTGGILEESSSALASNPNPRAAAASDAPRQLAFWHPLPPATTSRGEPCVRPLIYLYVADLLILHSNTPRYAVGTLAQAGESHWRAAVFV